MYQRRNPRQEMAALRRFGASVERPFPDFVPPKDAGKKTREFYLVSSLLRRIQYAEDAGLLMKLDSEMQRTIRDMERELTIRQLRAFQ